MSEEAFKKARGNLAFSQQLVDKLHQQQMPQEMPPESPVGPDSAPEAPQENPIEETAPQPVAVPLTPPEVKNEEEKKGREPEEKGLGASIKEGVTGMEKFFTSMGDYFKTEEERELARDKREEENRKKLGAIQEQIKEIVEE